MARALLVPGVPVVLALAWLSACAAKAPGSPDDSPAPAPDQGASDAGPGGFSDNNGGSGGPTGSFADGGAPGMPANDAGGKILLYAHTDTTLFQLDPKNLSAALGTVGDFDCIGTATGQAPAMTDLAVGKDGKLYGVSETAAYPLTVQGAGVHCDASWPLPSTAKFYGLTMAPEGTVAKDETLIAANGAGELFRIDATTGATTQVGTLGADSTGQPYQLSGDIVFLANGGNPIGFATVRTCTPAKKGKPATCSGTDTLIEVDVSAVKPGTQSALKAVRGPVNMGAWCTNPMSPATFGSMFGVAAFEDKVYGFSRKGDFVEIHNTDGSGCLVASYDADKFAGAGVTTIAPVVAPPPPPPPK
jgi:hypothetical protein